VEFTHGISIKSIFLANANWGAFFLLHQFKLRPAIIKNGRKMLSCKTSLLGFHLFTCPKCDHLIKVYHSCKSRFCSSCGKKATDKWVQEKFEMLPNTPWQHITFTMPSILWDLFWVNRHLIGLAPKLAAEIILKEARLKKALPGIFLAIHTFGRDLKRNMHFHLSTTGVNCK